MQSRTDTSSQARQMAAPAYQFGQMIMPFQQFGAMLIDSVSRLSDYQLEMMQTYTHFAVGRMRDALEVRDANSLRDYIEKQSRASEEFARKMASETQQLMNIGQEMSSQGLRVIQATTERSVSSVERGARQMQEQAASAMQQQAQAASGQQRADNGSDLPIRNYDDLTISEIEQRLDKLDTAAIRKLYQYERSHKNRKTLNDAFERRL